MFCGLEEEKHINLGKKGKKRKEKRKKKGKKPYRGQKWVGWDERVF